MATYILTRNGYPPIYREAESAPRDLMEIAERNADLRAQVFIQDECLTKEIYPGWRKKYLWKD
jgi:hypothetical protein